MLEAAGVFDPSADTAGVVLSVILVIVLWGILAVKDKIKRD